MRCTQEQFNAIKHKLTNLQSVTTFTKDMYLTNNLSGGKGFISNISGIYKRDHNREVYEEWNERIFLEACGIIPCTIQDRLANLEKEIKEVKALIEEENKLKIGDICKFWDDDKSKFIVGKLERFVDIADYLFCVDGLVFKNCEKITDETFLKSFSNL